VISKSTGQIYAVNVVKQHREQLKQVFELNEVINTVMILKDQLNHIWSYRSRTWANKAIDNWCALAKSLNIGF
jgi:hypothetical protein